MPNKARATNALEIPVISSCHILNTDVLQTTTTISFTKKRDRMSKDKKMRQYLKLKKIECILAG